MSENLIDVLSSIEGLRVVAARLHSCSATARTTPRTIGAKLNVSYLLTGSVQRSSDTIRVRAEVVDTHTGASVFSRRFERPGGDLFALRDELADCRYAERGAAVTDC